MIKVSKHPPSGTIALDRIGKRNALTREMVDRLIQALSDFHQQANVRAVILTHSGSVFCSGVDLNQWQESTDREDAMEIWFEDAVQLQRLLESMLKFPKPIIAAVDGAAVGFGVALMLACDLVVASNRSTFSVPAVKRGLVSGLVTPLLNFRAGAGMAARMTLGCDELTAEEFKTAGIVHHIVASDQIWVRANAMADSISQSAAESVQLSKRLLNEMVGESLSVWLSNAAAATASACTTEAAKEGMRAFVEKRAANFAIPGVIEP
jgi:enoyl-CoA hydratase/carnithine racemase